MTDARPGMETGEPFFYGDECPAVRALKRKFPDADGVLVSRDFTVIVRGEVAERYGIRSR